MKNLFDSINVERLFEEATQSHTVAYRDPFGPPYADPERMTATQKKAWKFFRDRSGKKTLIGMVGAKGSSKTHFGACFAAHQMQVFPESMGCIISNTFDQAKSNAAPIFMKVMESLGYEVEFFNTKKIRGKPFSKVFVVTLGEGIYSYLLLRSFERVDLLEGAELDWLWCEEVQDAEKEDFNIVWSRNRGQYADNSVFVAAMPEDGAHWQYTHLPKIGFVEEEGYTGPVVREVEVPGSDETLTLTSDGILYEPSLFENIHNLDPEYVKSLYDALDEIGIQRYVHGKRTSNTTNRVFYSYDDQIHRSGRMSRILCHYDPRQEVIFSLDFNVYPMSCSVWQVKLWADEWDNPAYEQTEDGIILRADDGIARFDDWLAVAEPDRVVLAQIDELEAWSGGTRAIMDDIIEKYNDHQHGVLFLGDATGNSRKSSAVESDWQIIGRKVAKHYNTYVVKRGLLSSMDVRKGVYKYSNPLNRDAIINANRVLKDGNGLVHVCFLPSSKLESRGVAASVSNLTYKPDGSWNVASERKLNRDVPRSHFADTFKYVVWHFSPPKETRGGGWADDKDRTAAREERAAQDEWLSSHEGFGF